MMTITELDVVGRFDPVSLNLHVQLGNGHHGLS